MEKKESILEMFKKIISTWWDVSKMYMAIRIMPAEFVEMIEFQLALDKYLEAKERLMDELEYKSEQINK